MYQQAAQLVIILTFASLLIFAHNGPHPHPQPSAASDFDATVGYQRGGLGDGRPKRYTLGDNAGDNGSYQVYEGVNIYTIESLHLAGHGVNLAAITCPQAIAFERSLLERSIEVGNKSMVHYLRNREEQQRELLAVVLEIGHSREYKETVKQLEQAFHSKWDHVIDLSLLVRNQFLSLQKRGGEQLAKATGEKGLALGVLEKYTWFLPKIEELNQRGRRRYRASVQHFVRLALELERTVKEQQLDQDVLLLGLEALFRFELKNYNYVMDFTTMPPYVWRTEADRATGKLLDGVRCGRS